MAVTHTGLLLIDKPRGISSHDVVQAVRRTLAPGRRRRGVGRFRCGHAGTLDPLATGLLLVLCGAATRLSRFLLGHDKRYLFTLRLGLATDTLDADGTVVAAGGAAFDAGDVASVLGGFRGEIRQVPPVISALKRGGRPLYARARSGEAVPEPDERPVRIHALATRGEARRHALPQGEVCDVDLSVHCSSGTYVRALARDIAAALGTEGHVCELRRTTSGPFAVEDALAPGDLHDPAALAAALRPTAAAVPELPALTVTDAEAAALRRGVQPSPDWLERLPAADAVGRDGGRVRVLDATGGLVALCELASGAGGLFSGRPALRLALVLPALCAPNERDAELCD